MKSSKNGDRAELHLDDGYLFTGTSFGSSVSVAGEVVFNTGMVGYTEALTDPSYTGQILVLTYPLSGNYGVPPASSVSSFESSRICPAGLVVSSCCDSPSHHHLDSTLSEWLSSQGVPGIQGVDTRAITRHLRSHGTMNGSIVCGGVSPAGSPLSPAGQMMERLSCEVEFLASGKSLPTVALIDCGSKMNIERSLLARGMNVVRVPWNQPVNPDDYQGVVVSNGPGDPEEWGAVIETVRSVIAGTKPVLGICLGHQIMALAAGGSTSKMKYGHRGQNQPCLEEGAASPRFFLTSQNHGYQVEEKSLPDDWRVLFRNVNDDTVEGIIHRELPFIGVQFHPEASPGPVESAAVFDQFVSMVRNG